MWTPEPIDQHEMVCEAPKPSRGRRQNFPVQLAVTLSRETDEQLRAYCFRHEVPLAVWIRQAIRRELKRCLAEEE